MTTVGQLITGTERPYVFHPPVSHCAPYASRVDGREGTSYERAALVRHARAERNRLIRMGLVVPGPPDLSHMPAWLTAGQCLPIDRAGTIAARVEMAQAHVERSARAWGLS